MKYGVALTILLSASVAACSNRYVYETIQANSRLDCQTVPVAQQEECQRQASKKLP